MIRIFIFILIIVFQSSYSQELKCQFIVYSQNISGTNKTIFNTLEKSVNEFINQQQWTETLYASKERINCSFLLTLNSFTDGNNYSGNLQIQVSRGVFNSIYNSPLLTYKDNDIQFFYQEFDLLAYNPLMYTSNLVSIIAYYAYLIIGLHQDSFALNGGKKSFEKMQEVALLSQSSGNNGWEDNSLNLNRFYLAKVLNSSNYQNFHKAVYSYHRKGLDVLTDNPKEAKQYIVEALTDIVEIKDNNPIPFLVRLFLDTKSDEIANIFSGGPDVENEKLKKSLIEVYPLYQNLWRKI